MQAEFERKFNDGADFIPPASFRRTEGTALPSEASGEISSYNRGDSSATLGMTVRHCEERSSAAIQFKYARLLDCFAYARNDETKSKKSARAV